MCTFGAATAAIIGAVSAGTTSAITVGTVVGAIAEIATVASVGLTVAGAITGDKSLMDAAFWTGIGAGVSGLAFSSLGGYGAVAASTSAAETGMNGVVGEGVQAAIADAGNSALPTAADFMPAASGGLTDAAATPALSLAAPSLTAPSVTNSLNGAITDSLNASLPNVSSQTSSLLDAAPSSGLTETSGLLPSANQSSTVTPALNPDIGSNINKLFDAQLGNLGQSGIGSKASLLGDLSQTGIGSKASLGLTGMDNSGLGLGILDSTGQSSKGLMSSLSGAGSGILDYLGKNPVMAMGLMQGVGSMANGSNEKELLKMKIDQQNRGNINSPLWATS